MYVNTMEIDTLIENYKISIISQQLNTFNNIIESKSINESSLLLEAETNKKSLFAKLKKLISDAIRTIIEKVKKFFSKIKKFLDNINTYYRVEKIDIRGTHNFEINFPYIKNPKKTFDDILNNMRNAQHFYTVEACYKFDFSEIKFIINDDHMDYGDKADKLESYIDDCVSIFKSNNFDKEIWEIYSSNKTNEERKQVTIEAKDFIEIYGSNKTLIANLNNYIPNFAKVAELFKKQEDKAEKFLQSLSTDSEINSSWIDLLETTMKTFIKIVNTTAGDSCYYSKILTTIAIELSQMNKRMYIAYIKKYKNGSVEDESIELNKKYKDEFKNIKFD